MKRLLVAALAAAVLLAGGVALAVSTGVVVDGVQVAALDLEPGDHSIEVVSNGETVHSATFTVPDLAQHLVFAEDTTITEPLTLRAGDSIELRNGAQLTVAAPYDWQGTDTPRWSWDGVDPASLSYTVDRDIDIFGAGNITFAPGSGAGVIKHVEVNLQPDFETGHYPLHWHMLGDETRGTIVENVVVRDSTFRAFVPHASHGITFTDIIAKNVVGEAFWWDPPGSNQNCWNNMQRYCARDNSNDITVSRMLVDGVTQLSSDDRGYLLNAVTLGAGSGNSFIDSFVQGVNPTHVSNCAAYRWPESANFNIGGNVWTFERNYGTSKCHGIFVWQNDDNLHAITDFQGGGVDHGAYSNKYTYRMLDVPYFEVHATPTVVEDSVLGDVISRPHRFSGVATFTRVDVDRMVVSDNSSNGGMKHQFFDSTLTCGDVVWSNPHPSSSVWIDGTQCERP